MSFPVSLLQSRDRLAGSHHNGTHAILWRCCHLSPWIAENISPANITLTQKFLIALTSSTDFFCLLSKRHCPSRLRSQAEQCSGPFSPTSHLKRPGWDLNRCAVLDLACFSEIREQSRVVFPPLTSSGSLQRSLLHVSKVTLYSHRSAVCTLS